MASSQSSLSRLENHVLGNGPGLGALDEAILRVEWHTDELCPTVGFIVTNATLRAREVVRVYNGRANVENRIKEAKNTPRWNKTSGNLFAANQAPLKRGAVAYNQIHMVR